MKKKPKAKGKVMNITARGDGPGEVHRDAHGGKLGAFRGYGAAQRAALPEQVRAASRWPPGLPAGM